MIKTGRFGKIGVDGFTFYESEHKRRTWRQRLFSWPWRPWHNWWIQTTPKALVDGEWEQCRDKLPAFTIRLPAGFGR